MSAEEKHHKSFHWYEDCLSLVTLLSGCLSRKELVKQGKKAKVWPQKAPAEQARVLLDIHEACHTNPTLRKSITKQINRRFPGLIRKVRSTEFQELAEMDKTTEWPVFLLWACLTDPRDEVREYGRVLTHDLIWTAVRESFVESPEQIDPLAVEELQHRNQELIGRNNRLTRELAQIKNRLSRFEKEGSRAPESVVQIPEVTDLGREREIRKLRYALDKAEAEIVRLQTAEEEKEALLLTQEGPRETCCGGIGEKDCDTCPEPEDCRVCPLEGRRVAVIGGLTRMEQTYRQVVEDLGGRFEFHCGQVKNGCQQVRGIVHRSDYVVFITTVNSHGALKVTKSYCKKKCKKFIALKKRGVEAFEKTLRLASAD